MIRVFASNEKSQQAESAQPVIDAVRVPEFEEL